MSGFGEREPEDTGKGSGEWVDCPECGEERRKHKVRSHLLNDHGWSQKEVDKYLEAENFEIVEGVSLPPIPESERTPSYTPPSEQELVSGDAEVEESDLCDCDPRHRETQVIQQSKGGRLGPFAGSSGDGTPVIICKSCGRQFEVKNEESGLGPGFVWDGDGPGPL